MILTNSLLVTFGRRQGIKSLLPKQVILKEESKHLSGIFLYKLYIRVTKSQ